MSRAVQTLLPILQLVEQIFLHLPLTDLLIRTQPVNGNFFTVIQTSPHLQERLFFSSVKTTHAHTPPIHPNPLLHPALHAYINTERQTWPSSRDIPPLQLCELGYKAGRHMERRGFRRKDAG